MAVSVAMSTNVLISILKTGLLLLPEGVSFTAPAHENPVELVSTQLRACLTMLTAAELPAHSHFFGPISVELSPRAGRMLGAIPVIYVPQSLHDAEAPLLDVLGCALVGRIAQIQALLDEIDYIRAVVVSSDENLEIEISADSGTSRHTFAKRDLEQLTALFSQDRHSLSDLAGALQALSCLFYPTDKPASQLTEYESELFYYGQREWRIFGHVKHSGQRVDDELSISEREEIRDMDKTFFDECVQLGSGRKQRIDACRVIRAVGRLKFSEYIKRIWVPNEFRDHVADHLEKSGLRFCIGTYEPISDP